MIQAFSLFQVGVLCRMRHPHFVALLGSCSDLRAFIFEYLENGNLDDRMNASPSLTWQSRIRIAAEICDGLLFLHSFDVVHANLKPSNILLGPNLVAKIDLGFCSPCNNSEPGDWDPMDSWAYIDPETHLGAPHGCKSDIYSFGVILLQLLTGRPALLIADDIQHEVNRGKLQEVLDQRAGQWPFQQALRLANLALRCCCENSRLRPDLESDIWPVLNAMRMRFSESSAANNAPEASRQPPHHFLCPITQVWVSTPPLFYESRIIMYTKQTFRLLSLEIMNDPHLAADGYTYEKEAIQVWLNGGHRTSPMTNLPLSHSNLTPNLALRSAIRQWHDGEKPDLIRPGMDIVKRLRDIMAEVETLASEKSSLESIATETITQLVETSEKLEEVQLALDVVEKEKSQMQKQKDDVVQTLAQMLQEKLEMQKQRDDAIKEMEELRREQAPATMRFSQAELEKATNNFDSSLIMGQGKVVTVYKARLHHTAVVIKRLNVDRLPCGHEMDSEHPHFVTLIGRCSDLRAFIFEYLENGNLDDRMNASPSLTWQSRVRIAAEICDGLLFLHSFDVSHTNLKPSNILLDPNLVAKIALGFCSPPNNSEPGDWDPMSSWAYIDPETRLNAPCGRKSDIYSFGVILLQLLTGRPALLIADDIQHEVNSGKLEEVLDQRAGQWPFELALRLIGLALRCCCESSRLRPDLESRIWPVLNAMRMRFLEKVVSAVEPGSACDLFT
ncbi:putative LRR receptor-like serine/threonine-protein kinase [Nymphaea thermarum]|nr:putative LRR receptor-like serine/threonine-protein kinase [Nymphaea thermarum]